MGETHPQVPPMEAIVVPAAHTYEIRGYRWLMYAVVVFVTFLFASVATILTARGYVWVGGPTKASSVDWGARKGPSPGRLSMSIKLPMLSGTSSRSKSQRLLCA